jgi:hypothetical protein
MRTSIDLPDKLMKEAKKRAIDEGITLKELFMRSLENELMSKATTLSPSTKNAPWKKLQGSGSAGALNPEDSGFEGYSGPDWNHSVSVNEPGSVPDPDPGKK